MTFFVKLENGLPVGELLSINQMEERLPIIVGVLVTPQLVEPHGYGIFEFTQPPKPERYQKLKQLPPQRNTYGFWMQQWGTEPMTPEEIAAADDIESFRVRELRSRKLLESDWTQLPDAPLTAEKRLEWTQYRHQLRDITQQPEFPWAVMWPNKPE